MARVLSSQQQGRGVVLSELLSRLIQASPDFEGAVLVSREGLVIATAWSGSNHTESLQELDDSDIGAVACRAFEQSSQATSLLERGDLERLILAGSSGNMIILTAGADALCVVLLKSEAKLGLASNEARRISQAMVGLLEP